VWVIATVRVLGLTAGGVGGVVAAARRLVAYLQGGSAGPEPGGEAAGLAGYYDTTRDGGPGVAGWARRVWSRVRSWRGC
jgi:hypothetical protein